jgi:hypothetical protein
MSPQPHKSQIKVASHMNKYSILLWAQHQWCPSAF